MYYHCAAHRLNLAVVSACKIQAFKNAESYLGEIAIFFNFSAKRQRLLEKAIEACDSTTKAKKLKDACRTRGVQRIDSYAVFLDLLPALHLCLKAMVNPHLHEELGINWSWDGETITKANGFLFQLQSSSFLVSFQILVQLLQILRELTIKLQMKAVDVVQAYKLSSRHSLKKQAKLANSSMEINLSSLHHGFLLAKCTVAILHHPHLKNITEFACMMSFSRMFLPSSRKGLLTIHLLV